MDSFLHRARTILQTALVAGSDDVTVTFPPGGSMHLVVGCRSTGAGVHPEPGRGPTYQVMRKGSRLFVTGREGNRRCELEATMENPRPSILVSNQALYRIEVPDPDRPVPLIPRTPTSCLDLRESYAPDLPH